MDRAAASPAQPSRLDGPTKLALFAMGLAVLVIANDFTALSVALPAIERQFDSDVTSVQWVINGYALVFGVLIVPGGRLADLYGRRPMFFLGAAIFGGFSLLGGLAPELWWLIGCRALMGVGGALMWPAILGMTYAALPASRAGLAGGLILGAAGIGNALGPLLGGVLTDELSWRWILYLNVPIAIFAMLVTYRFVHQPKPQAPDRRMDYAGIATLSIGLVALLVALDEVTSLGWGDARILALLAGAVLFLIAFATIERGAGMKALVPGEVMRNESFTSSCVAILFMSATFFASLLYLPQFMQKHLGWSPLEAGAGMLPFLALFACVSFAAGPLYNRLGAKPIVSLGAAGIAAGPLLLSLVDAGSGYGAIVPGMVAIGFGAGLFYATATTAGITSVDESHASLAGGIIYMFQIAGGSIGLGLTTTVFAEQSTFIDGIQAAFRLDGLLSLVGFAITLFLVGGRLHRRREAIP